MVCPGGFFMGKGKYILVMVFFAGLSLGVFYANWKLDIFLEQKGVFQTFFLSEYGRTTFQKKEYLFYLMKIRLVPFGILAALSATKFRKPAAILWLTGNSFLLGLLFVTAVLQRGISGIVICLVGGFPQWCFYAPAILLWIWMDLRYPEIRWNKTKMFVLITALVIGILTEAYVNPVCMKLYLSSLKS